MLQNNLVEYSLEDLLKNIIASLSKINIQVNNLGFFIDNINLRFSCVTVTKNSKDLPKTKIVLPHDVNNIKKQYTSEIFIYSNLETKEYSVILNDTVDSVYGYYNANNPKNNPHYFSTNS